jgi:hypothetical protein
MQCWTYESDSQEGAKQEEPSIQLYAYVLSLGGVISELPVICSSGLGMMPKTHGTLAMTPYISSAVTTRTILTEKRSSRRSG